MAIHIEANYSKKLGLPQYSSHQYSITLRAELSDINQVPQESARLYSLMQSCVDREIQQTGFLPSDNTIPIHHRNGNGNGNHNGNGNSHHNQGHDNWACSEKQQQLILKIVEEHKLDKKEIDQLAQDRFSKSVRQLNKLEASGLIEELLEKTGQKSNRYKPSLSRGGR